MDGEKVSTFIFLLFDYNGGSNQREFYGSTRSDGESTIKKVYCISVYKIPPVTETFISSFFCGRVSMV